MRKDNKIVYGDFEITPNSPVEDIEFLIRYLSRQYRLIGKAKIENETDKIEFHSEVASEIEENLKEELSKFSYNELSKYFDARENFWKSPFENNFSQNTPSPQIQATQKARSIAREVAKPQSPESQK